MEAPPPSYETATGSSSSSQQQHQPPGAPEASLPEGWQKQYDPNHKEYFYVDTKVKPPRSIWHHPYEDDQFLQTLSAPEREAIQVIHNVSHPANSKTSSESRRSNKQNTAAKHDEVAADSSSGSIHSGGSQRGESKLPFGQKVKNKLTGTTHEQREAHRRERDARDREMYLQQQQFKKAMQLAIQTGRPQHIGHRNGDEYFIEPPGGARSLQDKHGNLTNPYSQPPYTLPNARFLRMDDRYGYGPGGYGSGYGMGRGYGGTGMGLPIAGGLAGGLLLGGLLGGF